MNVQFDEDNFGRRGNQPLVPQVDTQGGSAMAKWVVRSGLAKDTASADMVLTICAILIFGLSVYFFVFGFSKPTFLGPEPRPATGLPRPLER